MLVELLDRRPANDEGVGDGLETVSLEEDTSSDA